MSLLGNLKDAFRPFDEDEYMENEASAEETAAFGDLPQSAPAAEEYEQPAPKQAPVFSRREAKAAQPRPAAPAYTAPAPAPRTALLYPTDLNEATEAADNLKAGRTVFVNTERADMDSVRRIVDFLSGVAYAIGGKVIRVSSQAYLLAPTEDAVIGAETGELESSGLYL